MSDFKIKLPQTPDAPTKEVPSTLVMFGLPKCGKTTALSKLPNCLNIDVEKGSGFVSTMRLVPPDDLGPVATYEWFMEAVQAIKDAGRPYDFVAIETASKLDEISEWVGTWNYMHSVQGKKFNRELDKDGKPTKEMLSPDSPDYSSVHELADGNGYKYSRKVMTDIFDMCKDLGRICTIFVSHVADKLVISKLTNTEVKAMDLSLTGKVRQIYSREVDAIAYVYNKDGVLQVSFKGNEEKLGGMRGADHIQGYEGPLDWDKIFKLSK